MEALADIGKQSTPPLFPLFLSVCQI